MSDFAVSSTSAVFRPMPGHNPRNRQDRYRRVHYYVAQLGGQASSQLKQALMVLRSAAEQLPTQQLQQAARKQFTEAEFLPATKELLCIWLHLEAVDQGGDAMPSWLMSYLKLALHATDYLIEQPAGLDIMHTHAHCQQLPELYEEVGKTIAAYLGFGECSEILAKVFIPLLSNSRAMRQKVLKESLVLEVEDDFDFH
jgi:hypothetical protein